MVVFDVDGTLIGGEETDWKSFDAAFVEATGSAFAPDFFAGLEEVTAKSIVHQALGSRPESERDEIEARVRAGYLRHLRAACSANAASFSAVPGGAGLFSRLKAEGLPIAIATGDWRETITFKLTAAGIDFAGIPLVTSSEYYRRAEIIAAAVKSAGGRLEEAIYVGDGVWDLRACAQLGIPFIGVGRRRDLLLRHGAEHVMPDLEPARFWATFQRIAHQRSARAQAASKPAAAQSE